MGFWEVVSLDLGIGASAAAVAGATWGLWKLGQHWWNSTYGRHNAQTGVLDQLACTVSQAYVENLLGVPRFVTGEEHIYGLPGAWVAIQYKDRAVYLLSITITDADMWYRTDGLTLGTIDVRLGADTFAAATADRHDGDQLWIGNKQAGYYRHYHFGGAGGEYQHFWLSYNIVGAGTFDASTGGYSSGSGGGSDGVPPNAGKITANTLTVLSPYGSLADVGDRERFGPQYETLRLTRSVAARLHVGGAKPAKRRLSIPLRRKPRSIG
jgi:hypothetical protein